jgi:hypothetical protein
VSNIHVNTTKKTCSISIYDGEVLRLIFEKIPIHMFESFHKMFSGSNKNTLKIFRECGGSMRA